MFKTFRWFPGKLEEAGENVNASVLPQFCDFLARQESLLEEMKQRGAIVKVLPCQNVHHTHKEYDTSNIDHNVGLVEVTQRWGGVKIAVWYATS